MGRMRACALVAGVSMAAVGCSRLPADEISSADVAVASAEEAEAGLYAADEYQAAIDAKLELEAELSAQRDRFAPLRSYERAGELAAAVQTAAEVAEQQAVEEKGRARDEATELLAGARIALTEAQMLLAVAPGGKGTEADLAVMRSDLAAVETSLQEAEAALAASNYADARNKAQAALQTADQVKAAVEQAQAARRGRPRA